MDKSSPGFNCRYDITDLTSKFLPSTPIIGYLKCSFEVADIVAILDKTLNTSLMAVLIRKRLQVDVLNALRRTISNFSVFCFHECVSKVMVISKKANVCIVANPS